MVDALASSVTMRISSWGKVGLGDLVVFLLLLCAFCVFLVAAAVVVSPFLDATRSCVRVSFAAGRAVATFAFAAGEVEAFLGLFFLPRKLYDTEVE